MYLLITPITDVKLITEDMFGTAFGGWHDTGKEVVRLNSLVDHLEKKNQYYIKLNVD
jgi:hypothetical protein